MKKLSLCAVLGMIFATTHAFAESNERFYFSGRAVYSDQKAKNMETSARPGIGGFVKGVENQKYGIGSLAVGYQFAEDWRVEGEYTFPKSNEFTSGSTTFATSFNHHKVKSQRLMLNVYKDFALTEEFGLYVNAGLGIADLKSSGWQGNETRQYNSNSDRNIAYSVGFGATYSPMENLNIDLGYRYIDSGKTESGWNAFGNARGLQDEQMKAKIESQELYLGVRYFFKNN
ncbi:outer membrane protein [Ignatzschineria sp. LJL83]